jgi:hypothetical protein
LYFAADGRPFRPTAVNGPYRAGAFRGDLTQGVALG